MARYRKIDTRTWNDHKFNDLSDDGKLTFFLLLTHPHLTPVGAMRATLEGLASELGWPVIRFKKALEEGLLKTMIKYDEIAAFIWLPNFLKYNQPESPNVVRSWEQYLDYIPECSLKDELIYSVKIFVETLSFTFREALPQAFLKGIHNQEQEQEQEQKQKKDFLSGKPDIDLLIINESNKNESIKTKAIRVLEFLNQKTGRVYRPVDANLKLITARLHSGATVMDCRQVIAKKTREWKGDPKMAEYLRPATLFNATKFEQYLGELILPEEEFASGNS